MRWFSFWRYPRISLLLAKGYWDEFLSIKCWRHNPFFISMLRETYSVTLSSIFFILSTSSHFTGARMTTFSYRVNISEFLILLLLCLIYFYELFDQKKQLLPFKKTGSFLIVAGLFFYTLISLPFLLIGDKLVSYSKHLYHAMFSMHYFSIGVLFICLAKAFKCKTSLTT